MVEEAKSKKRRFKPRGGTKKKPRKSEPAEADGSGSSSKRPENDGGGPRQFESSRKGRPAPLLSVTGSESTTLDRDLFTYLVRIQDELNSMAETDEKLEYFHGVDETVNDFDSDMLPPSVLIARNALSEIVPRLHEVAMDPAGSRIVESVLQYSFGGDVLIEAFNSVLSLGANRVLALAQHRCASHVLQGILNGIGQMQVSPALTNSMHKFGKVIQAWDYNSFKATMEEMSGSHVLRSVFAVLAGIPFDEPREAKIDDSNPTPISPYFERSKKNTLGEWHLGITHCAQLIVDADAADVQKMAWSTASCGALQSLVAATTVADRALSKKLVKHVHGEQLSDLVFDRCGSRFVERAITCLGAAIVWDKVKGHLCEMIDHPKGNFVVQRLFLGMKGRAQVKSAWDEVEEKVPGMVRLRSSREGVVLSMLRAAEAEGGEAMQRRASKCIAKAFGATRDNAKNFTGIVLAGSVDAWSSWRERIGKIGDNDDVYESPLGVSGFKTINMLMARCLLRYPGAAGQVARDSMATLSPMELLVLSSDAVSSRLLEQWLEIDPKNCVKVLEAVLRGDARSVMSAARSPYGTMLLSKCIPSVPRELQDRVMQILASKVNELKNHRFGTVVIRKCRVESYVRDKDAWYDEKAVLATRRRMFADILNDVHEKKDKSKKKEGKRNF